jgi:Ion channel
VKRNLPRIEGGGYRFGAILVLTLSLAIFGLLVPENAASRGIELVAASAILFLTVLTSGAPLRTRRAAAAALAVIVAAVFVGDVTGFTDPVVVFAAVAALLASTVGVIGAGVVRLIVERGVTMQAVLGAITIYVLVGLTFGFAVGAIATGGSTPFFAQGTDADQPARLYYSFTVLTTTGFGDYTAGHRGARALAVLEMLIGQLYLVTVIAMLVGNLRRRPGA